MIVWLPRVIVVVGTPILYEGTVGVELPSELTAVLVVSFASRNKTISVLGAIVTTKPPETVSIVVTGTTSCVEELMDATVSMRIRSVLYDTQL